MTARILPAFLLLFATLSGASALEVRQVEWGFGGAVVPDEFSPLSVLLENRSPEPFDGELILYETRGLGDQVGARITRPFYLESGRTRWVQFYPYVTEPMEWMLVWGRGPNSSYEIEAPRGFSAPVRVLLVDEENPFDATVRIRTFPDQRFPTVAGATAGLDAVVLDHSPRWEPARRDAFLAWLRGGGTVHLLRDVRGERIHFPGELAALNAPAESFPVGRGRVVQHALSRRQIGKDFFKENGPPERALESGSRATIYRFDSGIFRALGALTRPNINWSVILLLTFLYLLLVGPVHYLVGKRYDYRITIGAYLALVALFALLFAVVGRRGYGEQTVVHSLSLARALGDAKYEVTQWSSLFVTKGGDYTVRYQSAGDLFSVDGESRRVNAAIANGKEGRLSADMPLYSSRPYLHRAVMQGEPLEVAVESRNSDGKPTRLRIVSGIQPLACWVRHRGYLYDTVVSGKSIALKSNKPIESFLDPNEYNTATRVSLRMNDPNKPDAATTMRKMAPLILARSLGGTEQFSRYLRPRLLPDNEAEVFLFATSPAGFAPAGDAFKREVGYTLYDVLAREQKSGSKSDQRTEPAGAE